MGRNNEINGGTDTVRKPWSSGLARLLIAMLLLQCLPIFGGENTVQAAGAGNGDSFVQLNANPPTAALTDYKWKQVQVNLSPEARQAASMVRDEVAGNVILFGGEGVTLLNDTWIWDGQQQTWQDMLQLTLSPDKRKSAAMAYDPNIGKVLLFGGEGESGVLGDTWLWDGLNARWEQVTGLADSPSARGGAQMAFDGENLVLFGGYELSGSTKTPLGDMWLWDGAGWTEAHPAVMPPALHSGQMVYNGEKALLFGGNKGPTTGTYTSTHAPIITKPVTFDRGSNLLWLWDRVAQSWSSIDGPVVEDYKGDVYGRWGNAMAYDGRRIVNVGGVTSYINMTNLTVIPELKLPNDIGMTAEAVDGWAGEDTWEYLSSGFSTDRIYQRDWREIGGNIYPVRGVDNQREPFPISYANMAFDGQNLVYFGGHRDAIVIYDNYNDNNLVGNMPAGTINETWLFGVPQPSAPGVRLAGDPVVSVDENDHANDVVSVVTSVYDNGTKEITARGIEYRVYPQEGNGAWTDVPYTGSASAPGSFTVQLTGLEWMQQYEVRGYAVNELGKSFTEIKRFRMESGNVEATDLQFNRVGAAVLHVKDKKRLVAVGTGISNLLSKSPDSIHYFLKDSDGAQYPLNYSIINDRQLELTWEADLPPGQYDVHLEHDFFHDRVFDDGLLLTESGFYKPRNFASIEVASTSIGNEANSLKLKGIFTEDPLVPNVYVLNDATEPVVINDSLLFKGASLVVDKRGATTTISGDGRLYVNSNGPLGPVSYTLY
ncbi:kelch repeat-containing protein, partial [Cohnella sp.]|uniref:Kelch repeat-containing protein n=1 Tax=Cohnella sp. TaxID=1883426 RepID=UPI0037042A76